MDNKLKNYTEQPDPEVWNKIENTLHRRALHRHIVKAGVGVIAIAAVVVALSIRPTTDKPSTQAPLVAEATPTATSMPVIHNTDPATIAPRLSTKQTATVKQTPVVDFQNTPNPSPAATMPASHEVETRNTVSQPVSAPVDVTQNQPQIAENNTVSINEPEITESVTETENPQATPKAAVGSDMNDTILWIPNAFTPASIDGSNTIFKPRLSQPGESITDYRLAIFNRRGMQVFHSNSLDKGWNGTYNGRPMPQGAYVYIIYYTDKDRIRHQRKGTVTLIR